MSIVLAPGVIVPFAGYTGATIDVIITLSEKPNAFTAADHLDVAEATAADPVALDPVSEQSASEIQTRFAQAGVGDPPRTRRLYDEVVTGVTLGALSAAPTDVEKGERMMSGGIHRAINEAAALREGGAYMYEMIAPDTGVKSDVALMGFMQDADDSNNAAAPTTPSKTLAAAEIHPVDNQGANPNSVGEDNVEFPAGTDRTAVPTQPKPGDFTTDANFKAGLVLFTARRSLNAEYQNELNKYNAYTAAVKAEEMADQMARDDYYAEQFGQESGSGYRIRQDVASFSCEDHAEVCEQKCHRCESQDV